MIESIFNKVEELKDIKSDQDNIEDIESNDIKEIQNIIVKQKQDSDNNELVVFEIDDKSENLIIFY